MSSSTLRAGLVDPTRAAAVEDRERRADVRGFLARRVPPPAGRWPCGTSPVQRVGQAVCVVLGFLLGSALLALLPA